ncbi:hypothetical protein HMN09_00397200 [Mycena chlorophos]|uniref:Uncharacterized protein n=1 Tax=Mycena chlorophos TaxID=658473 RepID=A0A8H6TH83_MYCCL|nr:hypothetical protein HMN09_00397200 [Mycena chlorophos]
MWQHCSSSAVLPSPERDPVEDKLTRAHADSVSSTSARLYKRAVDDRDTRAAAKRDALNWAIDAHVVEPAQPNLSCRQSQRRQRQIRTDHTHSTDALINIPPLSTTPAPNGPTVSQPDSTKAHRTTPTPSRAKLLNWMVTLVVLAEAHSTLAPTKPVDDVNASAKPATFSERTDEPNNAQQRELEALTVSSRSIPATSHTRPPDPSLSRRPTSAPPCLDNRWIRRLVLAEPSRFLQPTNHARPTQVYPDDRRVWATTKRWITRLVRSRRAEPIPTTNQPRPPDPSLMSTADVSANGKPAKLSKHTEEPIRRRSRSTGVEPNPAKTTRRELRNQLRFRHRLPARRVGRDVCVNKMVWDLNVSRTGLVSPARRENATDGSGTRTRGLVSRPGLWCSDRCFLSLGATGTALLQMSPDARTDAGIRAATLSRPFRSNNCESHTGEELRARNRVVLRTSLSRLAELFSKQTQQR